MCLKYAVNRVKRNHIKFLKVFANYMSVKGLISRYVKILTIQWKKSNNLVRKYVKNFEINLSLKMLYEWSISTWESIQ